MLLHLASLRFVELRHNVIFLGPPGTGKTHLSIALGLKACHAGYQVLFLSAVEMVAHLLEADEEGKLREAIRRLLKPDLLIVDEVGYIPFGRPAANLFFQVVNGRYAQGSMILTSNRAFSGWGEIFGGDVVVAAAMIDRLVHHAEIISLKGSSYRMKGKEALANQASEHVLQQNSGRILTSCRACPTIAKCSSASRGSLRLPCGHPLTRPARMAVVLASPAARAYTRLPVCV